MSTTTPPAGPAGPTIVFLDTETTGLLPGVHEVWEIAAIVRADGAPDEEYAWQLRPSLASADPAALRIGRYYERNRVRHLDPGSQRTVYQLADPDLAGDEEFRDRLIWPAAAAHRLAGLLDGAYLCGSNPSFDFRFVDRFLRAHGEALTARHRMLDIRSMAHGHLAGLGYPVDPTAPSGHLAEHLEVPDLADEDRHTALGDARWVRAMYDAITADTHPGPWGDLDTTPGPAVHSG